jgi:hypothetical protein
VSRLIDLVGIWALCDERFWHIVGTRNLSSSISLCDDGKRAVQRSLTSHAKPLISGEVKSGVGVRRRCLQSVLCVSVTCSLNVGCWKGSHVPAYRGRGILADSTQDHSSRFCKVVHQSSNQTSLKERLGSFPRFSRVITSTSTLLN